LTNSPPPPSHASNRQQTSTNQSGESIDNATIAYTPNKHNQQHLEWNRDAYYHPKIHYVIEGHKSNQTAKQYQYQFNAFLRYLGLNPNPDDKEAYDKGLVLLLSKEPEEIEELISEFLIYLKEKNHLKASSINLSKSAIVHFFKRNRVRLNKEWISGFIPADEGYKQDRPYTREEIQRMLDACSEDRIRVAILLMASTAMRVGTLTYRYEEDMPSVLEFRDITWLPEHEIYRIMVYCRSKDGRYVSYCSRECARILNRYLFEYRKKECGEVITETSPIIREQFDPTDKLTVSNPKKIMETTLTKILRTVRKKAGLESLNHRVKLTHGYRKYAITMMDKAGIRDTSRRYLTGHAQIGQDASYVLTSSEDLLTEYLKAEPLLIVDSKQRLQKQVETLESEQAQEFVRQAQEIKRLKAQIEAREIKDSEHSQEWEALKAQMNELKKLLAR
jgi:integrase